MKVKITLESKELTKKDLQALLQAIRTCEQESFPDKEIFIWIDVPELPTVDVAKIFLSIKPPFRFGPIIHHRG